MITLKSGLKHSLLVLEHLRNNEDLKNTTVDVGCFSNCRECGLTFIVPNAKYEYKTFCVYEHRNVDSIIINGKEGYVNISGDLPYVSDNKNDYIGEFEYGNHQECAENLAKLILEHSLSGVKK